MHPFLLSLEVFSFYNFYKSVFVAVVLLFADLLADCSHELNFFIFPNTSSTISSDSTSRNHTFVNQTKQCYDDLSNRVAQSGVIGPCSTGDLEVSLSPHSVLPLGTNISPHVILNITVTAFVPLQRLFVQFHCLHAPDAEDVYCHDHDSQIAKWGKVIWPCRELKLEYYSGASIPQNFTIPFRLTYNCFRLFSLSHYEVNITTWPNPCRMSFIATIPVIQQLEPRVREFIDFKEDEKLSPSAQPNWSPLLYVDVSSVDGVWIRFEATTWISQTFHNYISILIFERSPADEKTHMLMTKKIGPTQNGFRWENVAAGDYLIYAFVEKVNCQLSCEASTTNKNHGLVAGCKICPHTSLNFTLTEDRFTPEWRRSTRVMGIAKAIGVGIFVTLVIIVIGLLVVLFYLRIWRPRQLARLPLESIELTARPAVLLLYTDDCEEHSNAVMELANLLTQSANAKAMIDQTDLLDPSIRPSVWLLNSVAEAEFILMLFSEGSKQVMNGGTLVQRRPFPDLFNTALGYVVAKIDDLTSASVSTNLNRRPLPPNGNSANASSTLLSMEKGGSVKSQLSRFIVARFAYSSEDVIPEFFAHDRFGKFVIPQDIGLLIGRVHGVLGNRLSNFEHTADLESLNSAIEAFKNFTKENSDWLEMRLEKAVTFNGSDQEEQERMDGKPQGKHRLADHLERLTPRRVDKIPTLEEQALLAEKFGLLKPTEVNYEELPQPQESGIGASQNDVTINEPKKFQLVGKLEDFCSSSSSLSSRESN